MGQYYNLTNIEPIEEFDQDEHGNTWFNAKFAESAESVLWLAKEMPQEGKKYYGRLEKTKSGKRYRFRREQQPDSGASAVPPQQELNVSQTAARTPIDNKYLKDTSDLPYRVWKDMLPFMDVQRLITSKSDNEALNEYVMEQSGELLAMIDNVRSDEPKEEEKKYEFKKKLSVDEIKEMFDGPPQD